jgi:hypothetical protein
MTKNRNKEEERRWVSHIHIHSLTYGSPQMENKWEKLSFAMDSTPAIIMP